MALTLERHRKVEEIPGWADVAAAGGLYSSVEWLRHHENASSEYVVLRRGPTAVAAMPCTLAAAPGALPSRTDVWAEYPAVAAGAYPLLHCGTPRGYTARLLLAPGEDRAELVARLLEEARSLARERGAATLAVGHLPPEEAREIVSADPALLPLFSHSDSSLVLPPSFDAHLAGMRHKQRDNAKLAMRHFASEGLRIERRPLGEVLERAAPLIASHEQKYGHPVTAEFVLRYFGGGLGRFDDRTFCAMKDDRLVAIFITFVKDGVWYARANGVDEEAAPKRAAVYVNLTLHEVKSAIEERATSIHYGAGSLEMKARAGCGVITRWTLATPPPGADARALLDEVRSRLQADAAILRRHTLPQLPEEAIRALYDDPLPLA